MKMYTKELDTGSMYRLKQQMLICCLIFLQNSQSREIQKALQSISKYCEESRSQEQWVPHLALQETQDSDINSTGMAEVEVVSGKIAVCLSVG